MATVTVAPVLQLAVAGLQLWIAFTLAADVQSLPSLILRAAGPHEGYNESSGGTMTIWTRWVRQPQTLWLRKALFQVHLWTGIGVGLYILFISLTGSVLVYRNELFRAVTPNPIIVTGVGSRLTDDQLKDAAIGAYPGYQVTTITRARNPDQAVDVWLKRGDDVQQRQFDPYTGHDLGPSVPTGIWLVSKLIDLHDNLLGGTTGRAVNGIGALFLLLLALTGVVVWWPGIKTWRRSLTLHRRVGWKLFTWDLHSMMGFWSLGFILLFGITGAYLALPEPFQNLGDYLEPMTPANAGERIVDRIMYWLAFLHFGRLGGRGISWCGVGVCDSTTKAIWAAFGLVPAAMFVTGAVMWWTRVVRGARKKRVTREHSRAARSSRPVRVP
jgi:uncharacterized iron-regulated membrane protein